jgi:hypothetical protein
MPLINTFIWFLLLFLLAKTDEKIEDLPYIKTVFYIVLFTGVLNFFFAQFDI